MKYTTIEGIRLRLSPPDTTKVHWVGQNEVLEQLLACWLVLGEGDLPLCPRLVGKPGTGKTTLAMAAAQKLNLPLYIYQCTMDTRPEDLIISPVLSEGGKIEYQASAVVSAMIEGGVCILDEGNRMSEKSWASLAPLLDHRRYVESIIAGIRIPAHPHFRCCVTMNDDASTYELPDYILSRVQPLIEIEFPPREEELEILQYCIPFAPETLLQKTVDFLQQAHQLHLDISPRDGVQMLRYILKRQKQSSASVDTLWEEAVKKIVGPEGLNLKELQKKKRTHLQNETPTQDLDELFLTNLDQLSSWISDPPPHLKKKFEELLQSEEDKDSTWDEDDWDEDEY
ncbi:MAG: AAA family ATPase [Planctomycetota bacterium]|nr:MAG: AAA family ATPase [Planctomycetota bacterium]